MSQNKLFELKYNYCCDTSALVELYDTYPPDIFTKLWENFEDLIANGYLHAVFEVYKELSAVDDFLFDWGKKHKNIFKDLDSRQIDKVKEILNEFPNLLDFNKTNTDADPFIISHAICENCKVITVEKHSSDNAKRIKIPNVCDYYEIEYIDLKGLFREQKWENL